MRLESSRMRRPDMDKEERKWERFRKISSVL